MPPRLPAPGARASGIRSSTLAAPPPQGPRRGRFAGRGRARALFSLGCFGLFFQFEFFGHCGDPESGESRSRSKRYDLGELERLRSGAIEAKHARPKPKCELYKAS